MLALLALAAILLLSIHAQALPLTGPNDQALLAKRQVVPAQTVQNASDGIKDAAHHAANKAQSFSTQQIIIAVVVTALGVALVLSGIWYCCNRRRRMKEDEKSREARRASGRYSQI